MTQFSSNSSYLRQIRAAHERRVRQVQHDNDRDRILHARIVKAGLDPADPDSPELAARFLFRDTCLRNATIVLQDDRLWIGEGERGNSAKHQAGFGLEAMQACVQAWDGEHLWNDAHPDPRVMISVRDWLEPIERWSWDVRRTGSVPTGQPSFW
ncbi:MAG: hypothetical protein Q7T55_09315 [Solirubrobacteraceae bacterium]|nr:hypothetical protein [Solirubrobacteraceae bacterium]